MNTKTIKQKLRGYKIISSHLIYYLKGLIKVRVRQKLCMSSLYGDGMVLQCEETIHIKGEAIPGEWITVHIAGQEKETCSQSDGRWEVELQPLAAGGPYTLIIESRKKS